MKIMDPQQPKCPLPKDSNGMLGYKDLDKTVPVTITDLQNKLNRTTGTPA